MHIPHTFKHCKCAHTCIISVEPDIPLVCMSTHRQLLPQISPHLQTFLVCVCDTHRWPHKYPTHLQTFLVCMCTHRQVLPQAFSILSDILSLRVQHMQVFSQIFLTLTDILSLRVHTQAGAPTNIPILTDILSLRVHTHASAPILAISELSVLLHSFILYSPAPSGTQIRLKCRVYIFMSCTLEASFSVFSLPQCS